MLIYTFQLGKEVNKKNNVITLDYSISFCLLLYKFCCFCYSRIILHYIIFSVGNSSSFGVGVVRHQRTTSHQYTIAQMHRGVISNVYITQCVGCQDQRKSQQWSPTHFLNPSILRLHFHLLSAHNLCTTVSMVTKESNTRTRNALHGRMAMMNKLAKKFSFSSIFMTVFGWCFSCSFPSASFSRSNAHQPHSHTFHLQRLVGLFVPLCHCAMATNNKNETNEQK